jgi:hypothetical protein
MRTALLLALMVTGVLMATTFDVLVDTARLLESLREGAASAAGTTTTLVDTTLSAAEGHADDEWNGGSLFLKTDASSVITGEAVGSVVGGTSFSGSLDYRPESGTAVTLTTPAGIATTSDGTFTTTGTADTGTSPDWSTGTLPKHPVVPGSVTITGTFSDHADIVVTDAAEDGTLISSDGLWSGAINYDTGEWYIGFFVEPGTGTGSSAVYEYYAVTGSVSYATGALTLSFATEQTGAITATYTYSGTLFRQYIPVVADFAVSGGTVTFTPAAAVPTGTGDTYGLMTRRYPRWLLFQKLNEALREIKQYVLDQTDIPVSSLVNNEYALADSVRVFAIWNGNTSQTPRDWVRITRYQQVNGRLQFYDWMIGDTIRIQYYGDTTPVDDEQDVIPVTIDPMWLAYEAAVKCARWRLFQPGADEKTQTTLVNDLMARRDKQKARANIINPNPSSFKTAILPER